MEHDRVMSDWFTLILDLEFPEDNGTLPDHVTAPPGSCYGRREKVDHSLTSCSYQS